MNKNLVTIAFVVSGLALGYSAVRPAQARVSAAPVREMTSYTVVEASTWTPAPETAPEAVPYHITLPEQTIVGYVPVKTAVRCEHTENRLGGSITSYVCGAR